MAVGATGSTNQQTASTAGAGFGKNEETRLFLQLLLTQLQNQNPLDPVDVNEFTSQMVQYSSLEQQLNTNGKLDDMLGALNQFNTINGFAFVGSTAQIAGGTATVEDGSATWSYSLAKPADEVMLVVKDASGNIVYEGEGSFTLGNHSLTLSGDALPASVKNNDALTLTVEALDDDGQAIDVITTSTVVIDSMVQVDGKLRYSSGGLSFTFDEILSLKKPESGQPA